MTVELILVKGICNGTYNMLVYCTDGQKLQGRSGSHALHIDISYGFIQASGPSTMPGTAGAAFSVLAATGPPLS